MSRYDDHKRRFEARQRAEGFVRGPRITGEASERLRELAFQHRMTPSEVVSRLLMGVALDAPGAVTRPADPTMPRGFSDAEREAWEQMRVATA